MRKLEVSSTMPASIESTGIKNADTEVGEDRSHLKHRTRDGDEQALQKHGDFNRGGVDREDEVMRYEQMHLSDAVTHRIG